MTEIEWKPVVGAEGQYIIGSDGTVVGLYPHKRVISSTNGKLAIRINGKWRIKTIGRLLMEAFNPSPDPNTFKYVHHKDGNSKNNALDNLVWSSHKNYAALMKFRKAIICTKTGKQFKSMTDTMAFYRITYKELKKMLADPANRYGLRYLSKESQQNTNGLNKDTNTEVWVYMQNTNKSYKISNMGRIKCVKHRNRKTPFEIKQTFIARRNAVVARLSVYKNKGRYTRTVTVDKEVVIHFGEDLVATNFRIKHIDGDPFNNKFENLEVITLGYLPTLSQKFNQSQIVPTEGVQAMKIEKAIKIDGKDVVMLGNSNGIEIYRTSKPTANSSKFPTYVVKDDEIIMSFDTDGWNFTVTSYKGDK